MPEDWLRYPYAKRPYSDSSLSGKTKAELIQILRDYEHNYAVLYEANERGIKAAQEMKPKTAKWRYQELTVPGGKGQTYAKWSCSRCRKKEKKRSPFCPNCGARMEENDNG